VSISDALRDRIRAQADNRCGYCQSAQRHVFAPLEIDHLAPITRGGSDEEENLWLACRMCNGFKSDRVDGPDPVTGKDIRLFQPRQQQWPDHFAWSGDGLRVIGLTPCGRATVAALQMNNAIAVMVRREWVSAGWHPSP